MFIVDTGVPRGRKRARMRAVGSCARVAYANMMMPKVAKYGKVALSERTRERGLGLMRRTRKRARRRV